MISLGQIYARCVFSVMSINTWPAQEKPREKLLSQGAENLSDAEILAIFIRTGVKGKTAIDLARSLLSTHGSLNTLLQLSENEFSQESGLGQAKYATIQAAAELGRRLLFNEIKPRVKLDNDIAVKRYFSAKLSSKQQEVFAVLLLDTHYRVIKYLELFHGNTRQAIVHIGEVVKAALQHHASYLIAAHNHPSGHKKMSLSDKELTKKLAEALSLVEIELLDHYVV